MVGNSWSSSFVMTLQVAGFVVERLRGVVETVVSEVGVEVVE